ncbi:MAG: COG4315 family predicted lipoprotein, partial [Sciscionella sp.]
MTISHRILPIAFGALTLSLAVAACGGSAGSGSTGGAAAGGASQASVQTASLTPGKALVDGNGRALYMFAKDTGSSSTCTGACAAVWSPLLSTGTPAAGNGVDATLLGSTHRTDGGTQVTYHGHPLYLFVDDKAAGQSAGQGLNEFGGLWYVLSPSGNK